ncbi:hypothetical protein K505DRAFT_379991 [Melanomma pulvis-pyrius CBS 109.77]|uniref:Uncharacterized protein n=1 Tax=Melanomma pulvis-pyrius CBS 109.77 TaxID=1314802 RepID=A0A6A6WSI5_9PLEO|nr:hypothetical protein K505DRAFT_379991 [Melanomma pulvis-pyrius CBS 109.77]
MANQAFNGSSAHATDSAFAFPLARIQIPGLYVNDKQVDGEIYIQWTPAATGTQLPTSTVFVIAGPNALRPGVRPHDGQSNPQEQRLTESQADSFVPIDQTAGATTIQAISQSVGTVNESPTKQPKKRGPKTGWKRKKTVDVTAASDVGAPPSVVSSRKRSKTAIATDEGGDASAVVPTSTQPQKLHVGFTAINDTHVTDAIPIDGAGAGEQNGGLERPVEDSAKTSAKTRAQTSKKARAKQTPEETGKEVTKEATTDPKRGTVDRLGRKRLRNSKGYYLSS